MSGCDQETYYKSGIHLFRMVIYRAQLEAAGDYRPTSEELESHEEIIRAARNWLTVDSQDLRIVVHLAQISYEDFTRAMRKRFANESK